MSVGQVQTNEAEVLKDTCLLESAERERRIGFRRYAEYRDSGVEWVEEVPVGWTIKKLKFVVEVHPSNVDKKIKENEKTVLLCNYTDVYYNEEITGDLPFMRATASDLQIRKFTLKSGDIIITKDSEDPNDIAVPAYVPQDLECIICGYHLALLRPRYGILGEYLKRVMDSRYARSVFAAKANGLTRYGLGTYVINNFALPLPPIQEQKKIASYLDRETAKIDSLVAKQEQLIELLREKRQTVISHAVTKGLNPNAKMKDSGVEWLGEVPKHWDMKKLKHSANLVMGQSPPSENYSYEQIGFPFLQGCAEFGHNHPKPKQFCREPAKISPRGAILVSVRAPVGRLNFANQEYGIGRGLCAVVPNPCLMDTNFTQYKLAGSQDGLAIVSTGSTYDAVSVADVEGLIFPFPSIEEQKKIATFLERETAKIDSLIERCETAIELLKERRIALISAAVTGKIDVQDEA
jgi:type I restriction enzyme S subunit